MAAAAKTHFVKIGNSQGVRIPKLLMEQSGLAGEVELEATDGQIVIRAARRAREGWEAQFEAMAATGGDALLDGDAAPTAWDEAEWHW